ncbi:20115_t:CDS:2, partial [Gigaspora margarita]
FSIGLITFNLDYLEISWASSLQYLILYQNHFVVNLKNNFASYKEEIKLDDLCKFFSNINFRCVFVLLEIAVPYNSQVVSKSIQFDEFGKLEKIESKSLK